METRKHLYGETHPRTLSVYNSLAILYKELQRYEEAERYYIHVYKNQKMILGKHHPQTLVTCNNIGVLYKTQEQIEKAREYLLESMEGFTFLWRRTFSSPSNKKHNR